SSGPGAIEPGDWRDAGSGNSTVTPAVDVRPTRPTASVNHRAPSGPSAMKPGKPCGVGVLKTPNDTAQTVRDSSNSARGRAGRRGRFRGWGMRPLPQRGPWLVQSY